MSRSPHWLPTVWIAALCVQFPLAGSANAQAAEGEPGFVLPPIEKGFPVPAEVVEPAPAPAAAPVPAPAPAPAAAPAADAAIEATPPAGDNPTGASASAQAPTSPGAATDASAAATAAPAAPSTPAAPGAYEVAPSHSASASAEVARTGSVRYVQGRGAVLSSADEAFALALGFWAQLRYSYDAQAGDDRQLLQIKRARVALSGHYLGEHNRYALLLGFAPDDLARGPAPVVGLPDPAVDARGARADLATGTDVVQQSPLLDLYFDFTHLRDLSVRAGQFRLPFTRQRMIADGARQLTERAIADQEFQLDRDVGVMLYSDDLAGKDMFRYAAGVFIGEGRNPGSRSIGSGDRGFLYLGRFDVMPLGSFDVSTETDFARSPDARVALGAAYGLLQADATSPYGARFLGRALGGAEEAALVDFNTHNFTGDVLLKAAGVSGQAAMHYRVFDGAQGARRGMGLLLSVGYLLGAAPLEPVVRYSHVRGAGVTSLPDADALDLGINYYVARHQLRLTAQWTHGWGDSGFSEGDERFELQLQAGL